MPKTLGDLLGGISLLKYRAPGDRGDMSPAVSGLVKGQRIAQAERRKKAAKAGIRFFIDTYLKHHFTSPYGEHHDDLFAAVDRPPDVVGRGKRVCRVEPRYHGKTTVISLAVPLYNLAYQLKKFIMLVGESSAGAKANLATLVQELENNQQLLKDFPHLAPAKDLAKGQIVKWTDEEIQVASGAVVVAKGMGSRMRGMKRGASRPDLGIVDDPESPETAATFVTRQKHRKWFGGTFLGLGGDGWDVYVISNLPHHDCLAAHLLRSKEWDSKLYRAINIPPRRDEKYPIGNTKADHSPLWPSVWPMEALNAYKADPTVGDLGFAREMMNDPRDDKDNPFHSEQFTLFDYTPERLREYKAMAIFLDPAGGEKPGEAKRGRRDWACAVVAGRTKDNFIDIVDVLMTKGVPDIQINRTLDLYATYKPKILGVEENIWKNFAEKEFNRIAKTRGLYPRVVTQHQTKNKLTRILSIQPVVANGTVRFARHLKEKVPDYFGQFDDVPGEHDDGPDATEGVVRLLEGTVFSGLPVGIAHTSHWKKAS